MSGAIVSGALEREAMQRDHDYHKPWVLLALDLGFFSLDSLLFSFHQKPD